MHLIPNEHAEPGDSVHGRLHHQLRVLIQDTGLLQGGQLLSGKSVCLHLECDCGRRTEEGADGAAEHLQLLQGDAAQLSQQA